MVKLKVAEALEGKSIVLIPSGQPGTSFNRLDVNKMIEAYKDEEPAPASAASAPAADPGQ
jgi:hypothetical protein